MSVDMTEAKSHRRGIHTRVESYSKDNWYYIAKLGSQIAFVYAFQHRFGSISCGAF
jgi:hypothetical protein